MAEKSKKIVQIEIETNAGKVTKEFEDLGNGVLKAADSAEKLDASFEEVYNGMQPLTTRMGEAEDRLYELALAGDTASKEYQDLLASVGEYRKVQIQTDLAVDGAAQTMTQKLGSALNGATSGFAATQGAMALFGSENEALEESLLKVQSALAIQQGVKGLSDAYRELSIGTKIAGAAQAAFSFITGGATTALKLFRLALISTGIGAIVVAVGALIANFDKLLVPLNAAKNALKSFGDAIGLTNFEQEEGIKKVMEADRLRHKQAMENITRELALIDQQIEKEKQRQKLLEDTYNLELRKAKGNFKEIEEINKNLTLSKKDSIDEEERLFLEAQEFRIKQEEEGIKEFQGIVDRNLARGRTDHAKELSEIAKRSKTLSKLKASFLAKDYDELKAFNIRRENLDIDYDNGVEQRRKEAAAKYKSYLQDRLSATRQIEDIENSLLEDGIEKELDINEDKFRRLREDAKKNTKLTRKERAALIDLFDKQELAQQKVINQKYIDLEKEKNKKIDEEKANANQERIDKEDALFQLELDLMKDRQLAEIIALSQSYEEKYLLAQDNAELTKQLEEQFLIDQAAIEDKFRQEKLAKEKEATDKSIAEAQAEADAKLAIQNAQIGIAEAGIGLIKELAGENKKILAAALIAENAAGIAKIIINTVAANAKAVVASPLTAGQPWVSINSIGAGIGIASSVAATAKGLSALGAGGSPDSGSVPSGGASSAAAPNFNVVGDSGINQIAQLQQQPVQAFVVSGEVTTSQALDRNRVQNATL